MAYTPAFTSRQKRHPGSQGLSHIRDKQQGEARRKTSYIAVPAPVHPSPSRPFYVRTTLPNGSVEDDPVGEVERLTRELAKHYDRLAKVALARLAPDAGRTVPTPPAESGASMPKPPPAESSATPTVPASVKRPIVALPDGPDF